MKYKSGIAAIFSILSNGQDGTGKGRDRQRQYWTTSFLASRYFYFIYNANNKVKIIKIKIKRQHWSQSPAGPSRRIVWLRKDNVVIEPPKNPSKNITKTKDFNVVQLQISFFLFYFYYLFFLPPILLQLINRSHQTLAPIIPNPNPLSTAADLDEVCFHIPFHISPYHRGILVASSACSAYTPCKDCRQPTLFVSLFEGVCGAH